MGFPGEPPGFSSCIRAASRAPTGPIYCGKVAYHSIRLYPLPRVPVDFLSEEQERRYGRFTEDPSPEQLAKYFHFDSRDRKLIASRRGSHNRLGFALQLGTVRFLGTFLPDGIAVPDSVVRYVAAQLSVEPGCLPQYTDSQTRQDHAAEIRRHFGYRDFTDPSEYFRLVRWLYTRSWVTNQRPSLLFDLVTAWLVERKILLPGVTVLARLVARVRERTSALLWKRLGAIPSAEQRVCLETLSVVPEGTKQSHLERLRHPPARTSSVALKEGLERLREIRAMGVHQLDLGKLPPGRIAALAHFANAARAQAIQRMPPDRRIATLLAFAHTLARTACDDVLEIFEEFVKSCFGGAARRGTEARMKSLRQLDEAALKLRDVCLLLLDPGHTDLAQIHRGICARMSWSEFAAAVDAIGTLARPPDDRYYERVLQGYPNISKFLPLFLDTIPFEAMEPGRPFLEALAFLPRLDRRRRVISLESKIPTGIVPPVWQRQVFPEPGKIDRHAYTFCVLEQLCEALRRRDVFVNESTRWRDPRRLLLEGTAWEAVRPQILRALRHDPTPERALAILADGLDTAFRRTAKNLATNPAVRVEREGRRDKLVLAPLDKLPESSSLVTLREAVHNLLPRVDLPDVLLEVAAWTGFSEQFTHVSEGHSRVEDLEISIGAVLVAHACNIGFEPLVRPEVAALTRGRLSWVAQNYVRGETIVRANAELVDYQTQIPLAKVWGGGEVASADGMRFLVPVRALSARPNPKYFGAERGITYYNFMSNQFTGFHGIVVPGTLRDAVFILDGLLGHQTRLKPIQLMTDTAGYTDLVFGLFWLFGFQFSPRLADMGEARFWRIDRSADYGPLNGIARQTVRTKLITEHWDDLLRVAGSLLSGKVVPSELIRTLQTGGRFTTLARAIAEGGRVSKTIHLLTFVDDENYRRRILTQLNRQEGRHSLGRAVFHGQRGELRQRYREGQEDQLGALGLVLNAIVLWNTRYMQVALDQLRSQGVQILDEDLQRLSPLIHHHINLLGRYHFGLPEAQKHGKLRKLRDPNDPAELDLPIP